MFYRDNGQFKTSYRADQQLLPIRQDRMAMALLLMLAFVVVPLCASDDLLRAVLVPFLILSVAALGVNLLVGCCGQVSLCAGAFMAVGAGAACNAFVHLPGLPLLAAVLVGGLCATASGLVLGLPSLRVRGLYLAGATLAAQLLTDWGLLRIRWFTHESVSGSLGVSGLAVWGWPIATPAQKYLLCLGVAALFALVARNLARSRVGRAWRATRDGAVAAQVIGIAPLQAKLSAFAVGSFFAGVAGALWGLVHLDAWEPAAFNVDRSFQLLFMVIIGGLGSVLGSFLGAAFVVVVPLVLERLPHWTGLPLSTAFTAHLGAMLFGVLTVFFLIVQPRGLAGPWALAKEKLRLWPFPH